MSKSFWFWNFFFPKNFPMEVVETITLHERLQKYCYLFSHNQIVFRFQRAETRKFSNLLKEDRELYTCPVRCNVFTRLTQCKFGLDVMEWRIVGFGEILLTIDVKI